MAVTPILGAVDPHLLFLPAEGRWCVSGFGVTFGLTQADRHETNPSRIRVHHVGVSDTASLLWADRPPPKVVRNPLRSDLTLPLYSDSWYLKVCIGNSGRVTIGGNATVCRFHHPPKGGCIHLAVSISTD